MCQLKAPSANHCSHILPSLIPASRDPPSYPWLGLFSHLGNSAFPPANPLPMKVKQGSPFLISLILAVSPCLSPPPPPAQPHHCHVAIRLFQVGCVGHWWVLPASGFTGGCAEDDLVQEGLPVTSSLTSCQSPEEVCIHLLHCPHWLQGHPVGQRGRQRAVVPSLCHPCSCCRSLQPGHTRGSF